MMNSTQMLALHLALHGSGILAVALVAGLLLYRAILENGNEHGWHLLHAGGSGRGIMLLALAAIIHLPALPALQLWTMTWLFIIFCWASTLAMILTAASGHRGFGPTGPPLNKVIYALYVIGTITIFPGVLMLIVGLTRAII